VPLRAEVVRAEDAGAGFSDVGALEAAKEALREAVQLPLQHPQLFLRGSLAKPCKGVLLFGPPGHCASHSLLPTRKPATHVLGRCIYARFHRRLRCTSPSELESRR
jgi:hypothetical protein